MFKMIAMCLRADLYELNSENANINNMYHNYVLCFYYY